MTADDATPAFGEFEDEEGDVVRWTDKGYTYAAIFVAGHWYLSGGQSYYGTARMTSEQLLKVLRRSHVRELEFAATWDTNRITD